MEQELETDEISTALRYVWWAKRVKTDPFLNVSSNCVPPFEEPRTPTFVLWIGTSISKVIDEKKVGIEAGVVVEKEKMYTMIRDRCFKPHLNLHERLATLVSRRWYSVVFIEVGTNDISNAPVENSQDLLELKLASYFSSVVSVLRPGLKVIVVLPIPRLDSRQVINQWFCDRLAQIFHGLNNVQVRSLGIMASTWQADSLYGREDLRDGVHLLGEDAVWWATRKATLLVKEAFDIPSPWWSAGSRSRSQDEIDQVKFFV